MTALSALALNGSVAKLMRRGIAERRLYRSAKPRSSKSEQRVGDAAIDGKALADDVVGLFAAEHGDDGALNDINPLAYFTDVLSRAILRKKYPPGEGRLAGITFERS